MSKKFKNRLCAYCQVAPSTRTGDHVFAREFFAKDARDGLPKVPACERCNNQKSKLEHYLTAVLPFGGRHADASTTLSELVPGRLVKNARFYRELAVAGEGALFDAGAGQTLPILTIPFDGKVLEALFDFIVRGLIFYHWGTRLKEQHSVRVITLTEAGEAGFARIFEMNAREHVEVDLGGGTFRYVGKQGDYPELTVWGFEIYGGLVMTGDLDAPDKTASGLGAISATCEFLESNVVVDLFGE